MTIAKLRIISAAVLLSCSLMAQAAINLADQIPVAPDVKVGKLPNGLTYYIKKNGRPEKKLELRLVVKAGSILEDEDQRGLAHFTEHMAFNGSTNFKRHELISYLQSIGVKFGADLNAYTSFDETVYMLPIPTDKKESVEKGFLVLEDWAHGLTLNDADIDSERGIVLEELRAGKGASDRMNKQLWPKLFNGSRYADRLPIGKEETLKSFKPEAIKRFYKDWYRPDLMAVIVVGDIEPAEAERLVRQHFGKLKQPDNPRPRVYAQIPSRTASESLVVTDKEAAGNMVFIRYPIERDIDRGDFADYREQTVERLYSAMLGQRMAELTQRADPPFIQGGSSRGKVALGYRSFQAGAVLGKGGALPAIQALVQEDERARQFGFTASELERTKKNMLRGVERSYAERDKSDSVSHVGELIRNFLENEPIPGIANEYQYLNELIPGITLDEVNAAMRKAVPSGQPKLVVYMGSDKAETPVPKGEELLAAVNAAEAAPVKAQEEKVYATQLMDTPPKAGTIVKETVDKALGTTELVLSNGVRVVLKPTDFKNDQVLMGAHRPGGQSLYEQKDFFNARYASTIVSQMGLMNYSPLELGKVLAGRTVNSGASIVELSEGLRGNASSADLETMLQLVHLQFTQPRKDAGLYASFIGKQREMARTTLSNPDALFADTLIAAMYNNNPLVPRVPRVEDFDRIQLDRVLEIYKERFASARDFSFFLVGSFDVAKVKPLLATYLASLPAPAIPAAYRDQGVRPVKGVVKTAVYKGTEPKSKVTLVFSGDAAYSEEEQMRFQALLEVANIKLIEVLREKMGLIYSGQMGGGMAKHPYGSYNITASLPCAPDNVDMVVTAAMRLIRTLQEEGPDPADLAKVKENWTTNHRKSLRENGYWLGRLQSAHMNGTDPASILHYAERVAEIKPADVQAAAKRYFNLENYVQAVLYPEAKQ
ncbi:M16 family metallopeptidase [Pseudoduganella namucuonensis]|uniref:Zinc protease n=1 Tax=Pseudoduganella namucuonensis TaxID=1035707 RepID=A0A1I7JKV8_9BURK|nr:insulinase family protein [Pseudoduganella namucuonensis]SFU85768.1 zinc protease [Pseudoduganella namucuonensis]